MTYPVSITVNGTRRMHDVDARLLLVHYLRDTLGLTGTNVGCDTSQCGSCTVLMDGKAVKSCTVLAVQADGAKVTTIEGLATNGKLHPLQDAFWEKHGLQCGFCTPGMILTACNLLEKNPKPSEAEIRHGLEGNLCRCTGYQNIVAAVKEAADAHGEREGREEAPMASRIFGSAIKRREDPRLITGQAKYTDDFVLPGMAYLSVVRSPYAHAKILGIRTKTAAAMEGVLGVFTGKDMKDAGFGGIPCAWVVPGSDTKTPAYPPIAIDTVRYVGNAVAIVVARTATSPGTPPTPSRWTTTRFRR